MTATVTQLTLAPVKGMQVTPVDRLELGALGADGDRAFFVLDPDNGWSRPRARPGCSPCSRTGTRRPAS